MERDKRTFRAKRTVKKRIYIIAALAAVNIGLLAALGIMVQKLPKQARDIKSLTPSTRYTQQSGSAPERPEESAEDLNNASSAVIENTSAGAEGTAKKSGTLKKFLQNAVKPVGSTLYVYGGGWNEEDTGAGESAVTIGVSPEWKAFYDTQDADYDSSGYRYQIEKGLDCSGYVGWVIYNTLETENGKEGYVFTAQECVDRYAAMGFGTKTERGAFSDYKPGDILASPTDKHVWISLGQCEDGSVALVNSSPPGVRICGTPSREGEERSEAVSLAEKFMKEQFPDWYAKFPDCAKGKGYLTNYDRLRWDLSGGVMTDYEGFSELTAEEVLTELFI